MIHDPLAALSASDVEQEIVDARIAKSNDLGYSVCGHYIERGMDGRRRVCWLPKNHRGAHAR
jgi:hypothetical protein